MDKHELIKQVAELVKTDPAPYNETTLEDWITEGDTDGMTAEDIAAEWDEINWNHPRPPLEPYRDEPHRNRRKINRRREELNRIAQASGWESWSEYETAVKNELVSIAQK